jgi:glycosyltransferase involved in cell wall biosynthesis
MFPKISIIIPCYNHGQYLGEAIKSVEECADKNLYEIIIINDGSTDNDTIGVLEKLTVDGYNVVNQKNQGLGAARNNGIKLASGEYILPLDSDNKIRPEYIYKSIEILDNHSEVAMVYGDSEFFGEKSGINKAGEFNLQKIMLGNYIDACAVYRKSVWQALGGYDEKMPVMGYEDWDFWLNMAFKNYSFHYIDKVLFDYRVCSQSMVKSINDTNRQTVFKYIEQKYKNYLNPDYINDLLISEVKKNPGLFLKLVLATYFPSSLNYLKRKNKIRNKKVFM